MSQGRAQAIQRQRREAMIGDAVDQWIELLVADDIELRRRILACQSLADFLTFQGEVRAKWDADVASTRSIVSRAIARVEKEATIKN